MNLLLWLLVWVVLTAIIYFAIDSYDHWRFQ